MRCRRSLSPRDDENKALRSKNRVGVSGFPPTARGVLVMREPGGDIDVRSYLDLKRRAQRAAEVANGMRTRLISHESSARMDDRSAVAADEDGRPEAAAEHRSTAALHRQAGATLARRLAAIGRASKRDR